MEKDILILGGGPSGLSTALHLTKIDPRLSTRILILEKEHYPRLKLCAGGLVIDAEVILERLGLDVREVPHVDVPNIRFDFAGKGLNVRVPKRPAIRVIRRDEFDHWLAKKTREAGIEIREGVKVNNVIPDKDGVTVQTDQGEFRATIVIGADGSNGVTRRSIFPNEPVYTARVLEVITPDYSHHPTGISPTFSEFEGGREDIAYFDFFPVPNNIAGYTWDFPTQVNGKLQRCWGIYDTNLLANNKRPALKEPLAEEMKRHGFDLNDYEVKGHPIRWYTPWNKAAVPRVLLVGDAVGADPIFGEGISMALGYGVLAAQEITESCNR
jgi:flavin-dependent dehydrogenase